jgi:hypothetical protein
MEKVNLKRFVTANYERQAYNSVLTAIEQQINRGADGYLYTTTSVTGAYSANLNDSIILANGTFTVTLPDAEQCKDKRYVVKNSGVGTITIASSAGNIDGAANIVLSVTMESVDLVSDGTNWWVV